MCAGLMDTMPVVLNIKSQHAPEPGVLMKIDTYICINESFDGELCTYIGPEVGHHCACRCSNR